MASRNISLRTLWADSDNPSSNNGPISFTYSHPALTKVIYPCDQAPLPSLLYSGATLGLHWVNHGSLNFERLTKKVGLQGWIVAPSSANLNLKSPTLLRYWVRTELRGEGD